jgi:RecA protein
MGIDHLISSGAKDEDDDTNEAGDE